MGVASTAENKQGRGVAEDTGRLIQTFLQPPSFLHSISFHLSSNLEFAQIFPQFMQLFMQPSPHVILIYGLSRTRCLFEHTSTKKPC